MHYSGVRRGVFVDRPNRFIAHAELDGQRVVCHVKNTGRCRELLTPGAVIYLQESDNPNRKTRYDLIAVEKGGLLINMDAQAPNQVFREWAEGGGFLPGLSLLRPETTWGNSRFDFYWELSTGRRGFVEVKGVTLEENGYAIEREELVREGETLYTAWSVQAGRMEPQTPAQLVAGRNQNHPLRGAWLDLWIGKVRRALDGLERSSREQSAARRQELSEVYEELVQMKKEWEQWQ